MVTAQADRNCDKCGTRKAGTVCTRLACPLGTLPDWTTPAPDTGRTAEKMRAEIRKAIVAAMPENIPLRGRMARSIMAAVVDPLLSEAAQLRSRLLDAEQGGEAMRKALKPFAALTFSYDGFSLDPAVLVFKGRPHGPFWPAEHAAFEAMIEAAKLALLSQEESNGL